MGVTFPAYEGFTPLFPQWTAGPNGEQPPVYAWRAYTSPTQSITSTAANPRPLSDIPAGIVGLVWYASPPAAPIRKTFDYGNARPYTFFLPDGTTRVNSTSMTATAYNNLVNNLWASDAYPT